LWKKGVYAFFFFEAFFAVFFAAFFAFFFAAIVVVQISKLLICFDLKHSMVEEVFGNKSKMNEHFCIHYLALMICTQYISKEKCG